MQHSKFASAVGKYWGFAEVYLCFLMSVSAKRIAEAIGILKKYVSKSKIYFCLKKKSNVLLNKNYFCLSHNFQTWFHKADHLLYCHRCLYSLFILFCSLISVSKKRNIEIMLTLPYSYNWQKFNNKMNEKRSQEYQSMDPEYVTGKINSRILELHLRWFCRLIFAPSRKS